MNWSLHRSFGSHPSRTGAPCLVQAVLGDVRDALEGGGSPVHEPCFVVREASFIRDASFIVAPNGAKHAVTGLTQEDRTHDLFGGRI